VVIIGTIPNDGRSKAKRRDSDVDKAPAFASVQEACQKVAQTYRILKFVVGIRVVIHGNNFALHDWGGERLSATLFGTHAVSKVSYKLTRKIRVYVLV
jgi:hypothetical protein